MKTRTQNLPSLHPNTIAALVGNFRLNPAPDGSMGGTVEALDLSAVYQARNVSRELVELVELIRNCRGVDSLMELYQESVAKLEQVAGIAVAVDDAGFPAQLEFAMQYARNPATPRRRAVFKAWQHLTSKTTFHNHLSGENRTLENPEKAELHSLAESFFGGKITARTLDDDIAEMKLEGFQKRPRGKPRKAG
jgi:hypothetical protein